jgi:hypothetical protein
MKICKLILLCCLRINIPIPIAKIIYDEYYSATTKMHMAAKSPINAEIRRIVEKFHLDLTGTRSLHRFVETEDGNMVSPNGILVARRCLYDVDNKIMVQNRTLLWQYIVDQTIMPRRRMTKPIEECPRPPVGFGSCHAKNDFDYMTHEEQNELSDLYSAYQATRTSNLRKRVDEHLDITSNKRQKKD